MDSAVVFAYCGEAQEVLWYFEEGDSDPEGPFEHRLYTHMSNWLVKGETFTILEYHPNGLADASSSLTERAMWWDDQLRGLGYLIDPDY